tara:strand:- start:134 stop:448 length:315 start_codon:yes stop_codon:yes gene_type:complete
MEHEKLEFAEFPFQCPDCRQNLEGLGAVIGWEIVPEKMVGHVEPGEDDGVVLVLDMIKRGDLEIQLQCANCGEELDLKVRDLDLAPEYLEESDDPEEDSVWKQL